MNKKFHSINLGRANPTCAKAALFFGAGFSHAEIEKVRSEKGKCYEVRAYNATYEIRFVKQDHEAMYGEFWHGGKYGGYGKFYGAELIQEIPQVPIKMIRGERYRAQLKNIYGNRVWQFDFDRSVGHAIYPLPSCDELEGYGEHSKGKYVSEFDIDFIVPERIWNEHYAK